MKNLRTHQACIILSATYLVVGLWSWVESGFEGHRLTVAYMGCGLLLFYKMLRYQIRWCGVVYAVVLVLMILLLFLPLRMSYNGQHYAGVVRMGLLIMLTGLAFMHLYVTHLRSRNESVSE